MPLWWLPAAIAGAGAVGKYIYDKKSRMPDFSSTAYARYMQRKQQEGIYPGTVKEKMLAQIGAEAGNIEQQQKAEIRGRFVGMGAGQSVAQTRALAEPSKERMRGLVSSRRQIEIQNEMSKQQAGQELASAQTDWEARQRGEKQAQTGALVGGLISAGSSLAGGYFQKQQMDIAQKQFGQKQALDIAKFGLEQQKVIATEKYNERRSEIAEKRNEITMDKNITEAKRQERLYKLRNEELEYKKTHDKELLDLDTMYKTESLELSKGRLQVARDALKKISVSDKIKIENLDKEVERLYGINNFNEYALTLVQKDTEGKPLSDKEQEYLKLWKDKYASMDAMTAILNALYGTTTEETPTDTTKKLWLDR